MDNADKETASEEEDNKCGICLEAIGTVADLDSCDHKFCFDCIMHWVKIVSVCPLCKKEIRKIKKKKVNQDDDDDDDEGEGEESEKIKAKKRKKRMKRSGREIYYVKKRRMYIPDDPSMTEEEARALWFKERLEALRKAASFVDSYGSDDNFDVFNNSFFKLFIIYYFNIGRRGK